jgi:allantoinase
MPQPRDRLPYSAIIDRPPLPLPGGAPVAVWVIVNVEEWRIEQPMPRTVLSPPMGQPLLPDIANWSWHEYGMRVGFWRLMEVLEAAGVTPTLAINGAVCSSYPRIADAARDAGWEFMGHGFVQGPMHKLDDQRDAIRRTIDEIQRCTGKAPIGWESPGLTETNDTLDHLAEAGIRYVADWVVDDQPVELATAFGPIVAMPYTVETNDICMMALQHHPAEEMRRRCIDQFDQLCRDGARATRIMAISVHPYITGAPHRIRYFAETLAHIRQHPEIPIWTGAQIFDWYQAARRDANRQDKGVESGRHGG